MAIAEVEGPGDYDGLMIAMRQQMLPACPLAIVTNFGGLDVKLPNGETDIAASQERTAPLVAAGFDCLTEVYARTDDGVPTGRTAAIMDAKARQIGFPRSWPVFGWFGGASTPDYADDLDIVGSSDYLAEHRLG